MGRSFSFSTAWARNARQVERRQRLDDLAQQIAKEHDAESPALDAAVRHGDDLQKEVKRNLITAPDGRETETNWVGYREGSELGLDGEMTHGGHGILNLANEIDYDSGEHRQRYVVESEDGSLGGEYEAVWEQTGEKQWTLAGTRRVTS